MWLSDNPKVLSAGDYALPQTFGMWKRVLFIAWNRSGTTATIQPLLRSFSEGSVWFDVFSIRPLSVCTPISPIDMLPLIVDP